MRSQSPLIVAIALACAGGAGLFLSGNRDAGAANRVPVLVAAADIGRGTTLTAELLTRQSVPRTLVPPGALRSPEEALDRASLGLIVRGEMVLDAKLAPKGSRGGIAALIPSGMRAFAIQIPNAATGVAGFILPGNKVDVLISYNQRFQESAPARAEILLENVEILAVDQRIEAPAENRVDASQMRSVTLLVTPDGAARLHDAANRGTLHLSLRNPADASRGSRPRAGSPPVLEQVGQWLATASRNRAAAAPAPPAPRPQRVVPPPPKVIRTLRSNRQSIVTLAPSP